MPITSDISSTSSDSLLKRKRKNYSKSHEYLINKFKNLDLQSPKSQDSDLSESSTLAPSTDRSTSCFSLETLKSKNQGSVSDSGDSEYHEGVIESKIPNIDVENDSKYGSFSEEQKKSHNPKVQYIADLYSEEKQSSNNSQSARSRPSCCVFVASLFLELSDEVLLNSVKNHFSKYGEIKLTKVLRDSSNRPYAFVQYFNVQDANRALKESAGTLLNSRPIRVEMAKVNRTLFVRERNILKENMSDLFLCHNFIQIGELEQVVRLCDYLELIKRKRVPELSNTQSQLIFKNTKHFDNAENNIEVKCWFVQFAFREDAISAHAFCQNNSRYKVEWTANIDLLGNDDYNIVLEFNPAVEKDLIELLGGDQFSKFSFYNSNTDDTPVSSENPHSFGNADALHAKKHNQAIDVHSIFVGQLTTQCTKKDLFDRFSKHGIIENIKLFNRNPKNCYAFITFLDKKATASAVEVENHSSMNQKSIHVQYRETRHINAEKKKRFNNSNVHRSNSQPPSFKSNLRSEHSTINDFNQHPTNSDLNIDTLTPTTTALPQNALPYSAYEYLYPQLIANNSKISLQSQYEYLYAPVKRLTGDSCIQQTYDKSYMPTQAHTGFENVTSTNDELDDFYQKQHQKNGDTNNVSQQQEQLNKYYTAGDNQVLIHTINQLHSYENSMTRHNAQTEQPDLITYSRNLDSEILGPNLPKNSTENSEELKSIYLNNSL